MKRGKRQNTLKTECAEKREKTRQYQLITESVKKQEKKQNPLNMKDKIPEIQKRQAKKGLKRLCEGLLAIGGLCPSVYTLD